jgi:hypothetical protein
MTHIVQYQGKFITADPGDKITFTNTSRQPFGNCA